VTDAENSFKSEIPPAKGKLWQLQVLRKTPRTLWYFFYIDPRLFFCRGTGKEFLNVIFIAAHFYPGI